MAEFWGFLPTFLHIISKRVEPGEYACIALPRWLTAGCCRNSDLFQGLPLRFQIGPGIVVGRVEADVAEPTADDGDIDPGGNEVDGGRVPEAVRRNVF